MAVPNTNTFTLQDVENEIPGTQGNLSALFAASVDSGFDVNYKGDKNSLYNFRNYSHIVRAINGFLYNWEAYNNANIAPSGWHVATGAEWSALMTYLHAAGTYNNNTAGGPLKESGLSHWVAPNVSGTNTTNFTGLGSGERRETGTFRYLLSQGRFWGSNPLDTATDKGVSYLETDSAIFRTFKAGQGSYQANKNSGQSIRMVKNDSTNPTTLTDYDGNVYDCISINGVVFTKQNWKCTRLNEGTSIPLITDGTTWAGLTTLARCAYNNDLNNV